MFEGMIPMLALSCLVVRDAAISPVLLCVGMCQVLGGFVVVGVFVVVVVFVFWVGEVCRGGAVVRGLVEISFRDLVVVSATLPCPLIMTRHSKN